MSRKRIARSRRKKEKVLVCSEFDCGKQLPANDSDGQARHMEEAHSDVVQGNIVTEDLVLPPYRVVR
jgi:hypothetical protein